MPAQAITKKAQLMKDWAEFIEYWEGEKPTKYVKTSTTPCSAGSRQTIMFLGEDGLNGSDVAEQIEYDLGAYDDDLRLKTNPKITILHWSFGFIGEDEE